MKSSSAIRAIRNRWLVLRRYAASAPRFTALPQWLFLGALRARLLGGESRRPPAADGSPRDCRIPVGRKPGERIVVDVASFSELDVFQEVLVERIYPLSCLSTDRRLFSRRRPADHRRLGL